MDSSVLLLLSNGLPALKIEIIFQTIYFSTELDAIFTNTGCQVAF
jgi:hypothetical protein